MSSTAGVCHVCGASPLEIFSSFTGFRRAASDCRPWPAGGFLGLCPKCGTVQKRVDQAWRDEASEIYSRYDLYHQALGGAEQPVFDQKSGAPTARSRKILDSITQLSGLSRGANVLDVGCGSGAMLRALSSLDRNWKLHGQEPNIKSRESLFAIPGVHAIHGCPLSDIEETFDFVSIIHALEHIETPSRFLADVITKLKPEALLLIQVPYFPDNPFDLLIADHCSHFTVATLLPILRATGLEPLSTRTDVVTKELTIVAKRASAKINVPEKPADIAVMRQLTRDTLAWLEKVLTEAKNVAQCESFGLFGTSISANWLFGELENQVKFFVDEDPNRIGTTYRGRPVFHPKDVPSNGTIYMVLPRSLAEQILGRLQPAKAKFHISPEYPCWFSEPSQYTT